MPPIPRPAISPLKPLSFEARVSLLADGEYLRKLTLAEPTGCECIRQTHFWRCDYCSLICSGEARPMCLIGAAQ